MTKSSIDLDGLEKLADACDDKGPYGRVNLTTDTLRDLIRLARKEPEWMPIETAPAEGKFLVYLPNEKYKIQSARWHPNIKVIGGVFAFDITEPTHWMPLPAAPEPTPPQSGYCQNKKQVGGCHLHNLQCGYPQCDQPPKAVMLNGLTEEETSASASVAGLSPKAATG